MSGDIMSNYTFIQHLEELRRRIIYCLLCLTVFSIVSYSFAGKIIYHLAKPIGKLVFIQPVEAFVTYIKISVFCGFFISLPVIIYNIWAFVSPGLLPKERKHVLLYAPLSFLLFVTGCAFGYFVMIPFGIKFLTSYRSYWLVPMISVGTYVSFVCVMTLLFGVIFELPVLLSFLSKIRVVNRDILRKNRKYAILIIFIVAAILTPPDVFSQLMMAIPLLVLYEVSILFAK